MDATYPDVPIIAHESQGRLLRTLTGLGPRFLVGVPPNADNWWRERPLHAPTDDHLFDRMRASASVAECSGIFFGPPLPVMLPGVLTEVAQNRDRWLTMTDIIPPVLLPMSAQEEERLLDIASLARVAIAEPNRGVAMPLSEKRKDAEELLKGAIVPLAMMSDAEIVVGNPTIVSVAQSIRRGVINALRSARIMLAGVASFVYGIPPWQDDPDEPEPWPDVAPGIAKHGYYYRLWVWSPSGTIPRSPEIETVARHVDDMLQHLREQQFYPTSIRGLFENIVEGRRVHVPWKLAYDKPFYDLITQ